jgi:hypothetical protein
MALEILPKTYHGNLVRKDMPDKEAAAFDKAVNEAFKKEISAFSLGAELIEEIRGAGRALSVLKAGEGQGNHCIPEQQGAPALNAACYQEVLNANLLRAKVQELLTKQLITPSHPAVRKFLKFYVSAQKGGKQEQYMVNTHPIAHKSPDPARKAAHTTEATLRAAIWEGEKIAQAEGYVQSLQNGLVGYHIMAHLTPGPGTDAFVVWDPESVDAGADLDDESKRAKWMERPSWLALVHELIHGWRLVTGRCVFHPEPRIEGYYEEAMTVGLPPYDGCKFTENRFRFLSCKPSRRFYGASTIVISQAARQKHKPRPPLKKQEKQYPLQTPKQVHL